MSYSNVFDLCLLLRSCLRVAACGRALLLGFATLAGRRRRRRFDVSRLWSDNLTPSSTHKLLMNLHQLVVINALPGPKEACKADHQQRTSNKRQTHTQQCLRHFFPSSPRDSCSLTISSMRAPMPATHSLSALILSSLLRLSVPDLSFFFEVSDMHKSVDSRDVSWRVSTPLSTSLRPWTSYASGQSAQCRTY